MDQNVQKMRREMENQINIQYHFLTLQELDLHFLRTFNRYQVTNKVWYKDGQQHNIKEDYFVEEWNEEKKKQVMQSLQNCLNVGGAVIGAYHQGEVVGFANVKNQFFGNSRQYLELPYIHVSNEFRRYGIGKKLFHLCCEKAKQMGAKKLYIAAHPSIESQHFYQSVGCTYADEIHQKNYEKEPLDIQLEVSL